jgi:hypothetical protein
MAIFTIIIIFNFFSLDHLNYISHVGFLLPSISFSLYPTVQTLTSLKLREEFCKQKISWEQELRRVVGLFNAK